MKKKNAQPVRDLITRRDFLKNGAAFAGTALLPIGLSLSPLFAARKSWAGPSSSEETFDYYIAPRATIDTNTAGVPNGSDSNAGTLASPWAITAINTKQALYSGKRVGILPGKYDVSDLMFVGINGHSAALMINGGPNASTPTYIGTCSANGQYQAGTATLDAMGLSGFYGGSNANSSTVIGSCQGYRPGPATPAQWGNWTLDGICIANWSAWAIQVGSYDGGGGAMPNCTIQNCQFTNGNGSFTTIGINSTHGGCMQLYAYTNCLIHNCLFQNIINTGGNATHWDAVTSLGIGGGSTGLTIEYCTFIAASGFYGIEDTGSNTDTTIRYCYFDVTPTNGIPNNLAMSGAANGTAGLVGCSFHHNIVRGGSFYDNQALQAYTSGQAISFYNNTWDRAGGSGNNAGSGIRCIAKTGLVTAYNNLVYDNGGGSIEYGYMAFNTDAFKACDYNIYGTTGTFCTYEPDGGGLSSSRLSFASWKTAIDGDAHSIASSVNPFTNNGPLALQYQVQAGSPAYQAGRVGGVSSGAAVNIGAWDGTVSQIGCSFAPGSSGTVMPDAPVLIKVG